MLNKFLDKEGLSYFWSKIKALMNAKANITDIPSKTSELTNDSGFITADDIPSSDGTDLQPKDFIITLTKEGENYTADKTFDEMTAAYAENKEIIVRYGSNFYRLEYTSSNGEDIGAFSFVAVNESGVIAHLLCLFGQWYHSSIAALNTNMVVNKISSSSSITEIPNAKAVYNAIPAWARESNKPTYTASEVGADPENTASSMVSEHNINNSAHNDIRLLVTGLTSRLNALVDTDDTTLDQLSEIVAYIKNNKSLIDNVTTTKVNISDIIDNLTTNVSNKPLSAAQGVVLKQLIDAIVIPTMLSQLSDDATHRVVTDTEKQVWNSKADGGHTHDTATTSTNGFLSSADKAKLDTVAQNANNYTHPGTHPASMITDLHSVATSGDYNALNNIPVISNKGFTGDGVTWYFPLGEMVIDKSDNFGNFTFNGRIGGWTNDNSAVYSIMLMNRANYTGDIITATVSAFGRVPQALNICDILVAKNSDKSHTVYLKCSGYFLFNFEWSAYQHSITYDGSYTTTAPSDVIWRLSTAKKTILDTDGIFSSFDGTNTKAFSYDGHSHSYNSLTDKPTILSRATNGFDGAICAGADGVAEYGRYCDFHYTKDSTSDFSTRFECTGEHKNNVCLPSSSGTLLIGDKAYKVVTDSSAPNTDDRSVITLIV